MNGNLLVPLGIQAQGLAKNIIKGYGLGIIKPKFYTIDAEKARKESAAYEQSDRYGYAKKSGLFNVPIWDTVRIIAPAYIDNEGNTVSRNALDLDIALFEISNDRNIVTTQIAGRNGTIKEYMSDGDYTINIKGSLFSELESTPPVSLLEGFEAVTTCPETLTIESNVLEYFRVFEIVILKPTIKQRQGTRNVFDFELNCLSDRPIELDA